MGEIPVKAKKVGRNSILLRTLLSMKMKMKAYTTDRATTGQLLNRLYQIIERTPHQDPHPGLIIASHHFFEPYPLVNEIYLLSLATMDLLIQFAYPSLSGYGKFTISFTMKRGGDLIYARFCYPLDL